MNRTPISSMEKQLVELERAIEAARAKRRSAIGKIMARTVVEALATFRTGNQDDFIRVLLRDENITLVVAAFLMKTGIADGLGIERLVEEELESIIERDSFSRL